MLTSYVGGCRQKLGQCLVFLGKGGATSKSRGLDLLMKLCSNHQQGQEMWLMKGV